MGGLFGWLRSGFYGRPATGFPERWGDGEAIFDHVARYVNESTGRLAEEGLDLPDEPRSDETAVRWMSGARDGVSTHHMGVGQGKEKAASVHKAVRRAAKQRSPRAMQTLHRLLSDGMAIEYVDQLVTRIVERQDIDASELRSLAKWLATKAPDRESVKIAMSLLGLVSDQESREILTTLATHDEFTLYAAVSISNTMDSPDKELWKLGRSVEGWGRIHVIERLRDTADEDIKAWLLREGCRNLIMNEYTALICARTGGLVSALRSEDPDDALIRGAGTIIAALITTRDGPAEGMDDYADGAEATRLLLTRFSDRSLTLGDLRAVAAVHRFLTDHDEVWDAREGRGWTAELRAELQERCSRIMSDPGSSERITSGLRSDDREQYLQASAAAEELGIDAWPLQFARLRSRDPNDAAVWYHVCRTRDLVRFREVLRFALRALPLDVIASGPDTKLGLGEEYASHRNLDDVLQALREFPGEGWEVIRAGLSSPVVRNRNMALWAIGTWGRSLWNPSVEQSLETALVREPEEDVRARLQRVLTGEIIEPHQ